MPMAFDYFNSIMSDAPVFIILKTETFSLWRIFVLAEKILKEDK